MKIAIFSLEADLHAHAVLHALRTKHSADAHFIATDSQVEAGGLTWELGSPSRGVLRTYDGVVLNVEELAAIWWRRVNQPQVRTQTLGNDATYEFINNEWKGSITGIVAATFNGAWINDPRYDGLAGNKLFQLEVASSIGLRTPATLVSSDPKSVLDFCGRLGGEVVVKKLVGAAMMSLASVVVSYDQLAKNLEGIRVCPAIYQERIKGSQHIRANCFGRQIHSVLIRSGVFDWRRDLSSPFEPFQLDTAIEKKLLELLELLNIRMGVIDLMISATNEVVWLELNTQGQFLFAEALGKVALTEAFAEFLLEQASAYIAANRLAGGV